MRTIILLTLVAVLAAGALWLVEFGARQERLLLGGALVLIGVPLLGLARCQLGAAFSVTPQAKGLVTTGLYARIRHPIYVFLDLALLGVVIVVDQAWLLGVWAALVLAQVWQAGREERVLEQAFGDAYRAYRKGTWW
jgi:protein-S-isoprenylcysteine O-methyltransferase Ste14